ncbi:hypothetical protein FACS1894198_0350 [Clostridia bacterium]|nr:hypothetical protein FACS1894198_0350 [Clostridia bacterium]
MKNKKGLTVFFGAVMIVSPVLWTPIATALPPKLLNKVEQQNCERDEKQICEDLIAGVEQAEASVNELEQLITTAVKEAHVRFSAVVTNRRTVCPIIPVAVANTDTASKLPAVVDKLRAARAKLTNGETQTDKLAHTLGSPLRDETAKSCASRFFSLASKAESLLGCFVVRGRKHGQLHTLSDLEWLAHEHSKQSERVLANLRGFAV